MLWPCDYWKIKQEKKNRKYLKKTQKGLNYAAERPQIHKLGPAHHRGDISVQFLHQNDVMILFLGLPSVFYKNSVIGASLKNILLIFALASVEGNSNKRTISEVHKLRRAAGRSWTNRQPVWILNLTCEWPWFIDAVPGGKLIPTSTGSCVTLWFDCSSR